MSNKIYYTFFAISLLFAQNSFSVNMQKAYKIPQEKIDSFFNPAKKKSNIFTVYSKTKHKAPYLKSDVIFVKEGLKNLGKYRWINTYNAYTNTKDKKALFFKKDKKYLISTIKNSNNNHLNTDLKLINSNNLSKLKLKKIFKKYTDASIDHGKKIFYNNMLKSLKRYNLLYLRDKEYILIIDKNIQKSYVFQFHKRGLSLEYIGGDKVSTGNSSLNTRNSRFVDTPIAIINRLRYKRGDWHADKTNFSEYGKRGNKVFYLGKYIVPIQYNSKIKRMVHLAIHSTNPIDKQLLGYKASKGCIRISDNFNNILRKSALIDGKNGKYVIILNSNLSIKENIKRVRKFFTYKKRKTKNEKYAMK